MKTMSCLLLGLAIFLISCGGGSGGSSNSNNNSNNNNNSTASDGDLATTAVASAPWSAETLVEPTTAQKTTATSNIQNLFSSVLAQASAKKGKTTTSNVNATVNGPNGGTATVTGTTVVTTPESGSFPLTTETEVTFDFSGYMNTTYSVHGTVEYSGTTTATAVGSFETTFTSHGGYSYKDSSGVYSFTTQMEVTLTLVDNVYSGTYTFVVNGETISGTF